VDEKAHHRVCAWQPRVATRARGAENNTLFTAVTVQEQRPSALNQCIQGQAFLLGKFFQSAREIRRQPQFLLPVLILARSWFGSSLSCGQRRGRSESVECSPPES